MVRRGSAMGPETRQEHEDGDLPDGPGLYYVYQRLRTPEGQTQPNRKLLTAARVDSRAEALQIGAMVLAESLGKKLLVEKLRE
jgi:predicted protein tyrosine phosphatase